DAMVAYITHARDLTEKGGRSQQLQQVKRERAELEIALEGAKNECTCGAVEREQQGTQKLFERLDGIHQRVPLDLHALVAWKKNPRGKPAFDYDNPLVAWATISLSLSRIALLTGCALRCRFCFRINVRVRSQTGAANLASQTEKACLDRCTANS